MGNKFTQYWFKLKPNIYKNNSKLTSWLDNKIVDIIDEFFYTQYNSSDNSESSSYDDIHIPLTFKANNVDSNIRITKIGQPNVSGLKYRRSTDGQWLNYTIDQIIYLGTNGIVQFKNTQNTLSTSGNDYVKFVMLGSISSSGNIQSMLNYSNSCNNYCYTCLFRNCSELTSAPSMPATSLASNCYYQMFYDCSELTSIQQVLPAMQLKNSSYNQMFSGCTSLTVAPKLPAMALANFCYNYMFSGCTSLITAPQLPAVNLAIGCYNGMFSGCINLTTAPQLPAATLANNCYSYMFDNCQKLNYIKVNFTDWNSDNNSTTNWLNGVADLGLFQNPTILSKESGPSRIPNGWNAVSLIDYIESTGTQYIDTGVKPDFAGGDKIEVKFYKGQLDSSIPANGVCLFGCRETPALNGYYVLGGAIVACDSTTYGIVANFSELGLFTMTVDDHYTKYTNTEAVMQKRVTCAYNMYLFTLNNGGYSFGNYPNMKLYDWKYYHNGVLAQHLIPVMDNNDVPCLYDTVSGTFLYNAGTGTFSYGIQNNNSLSSDNSDNNI